MTNLASDRMIIRFTKKQALESPLRFEVSVQIDLGGHLVAWTMDVLPGMRVYMHTNARYS